MKVSKTMPKGEARPLGTTKAKSGKGAKAGRGPAGGRQKVTPIRPANEAPVEASARAEAEGRDPFMAGIDASGRAMSQIVTPTISDVNAENAVHRDADGVESSQSPITVTGQNTSGAHVMTLKFKGLNKKGTQAIYGGLRTTFRLSTANFEGKTPPDTLELSGDVLGAKEAKVKMTADERKAARAAAPKPTLAQRAEKAELRAKKLRDAAAAEASAM